MDSAAISGRSTSPKRARTRRRRWAARWRCSRPPSRGSGASCAACRGRSAARSATSSGSERMSTTSAVSMATSVPAPMAMPTSAWASAGASLTPSPTIATRRPWPLQLGDLGGLVAGQHLGDDLVDAELVGDPPGGGLVVAGEHDRPGRRASCSAATAAAAVSRGRVGDRDHRRRPGRRRRRAPRCGPVAASSSRARGQRAEVDAFVGPAACGCRRRPGGRRRWRAAPWPGTASEASVRGSRSAPRSSACRTIACGERVLGLAAPPRRPAPAARPRRRRRRSTSVTSGSPLVRVPVLSITTVSIRAAVSSAVAFLNSMPRLAPRPVPTMIAVGVARPSASGQVITTTVIANSSAVLHAGGRRRRPDGEGQRAADQRDEHQPERGPVGQPLPGRLGVLRLLDQRDDLRQRGVRADLGRPGPQRAVAC